VVILIGLLRKSKMDDTIIHF